MNQICTIQTPEGPLALVRHVAQKLLSEGVISGTLDSELRAGDAATVKAAMIAAAACDFCTTLGAVHAWDVPDFDMGMGMRSIDGWAACDACDELIRTDKRTALLERSIASLSFPKFSRAAVSELHAKFWQGMEDRADAAGIAAAFADFIEDRLPHVKATPSQREQRVDALARITHLTHDEVELLTQGKIDRVTIEKLSRWHKSYGKTIEPRALADLLTDTGPKKPLADITPHWQRALDAKFMAIASMATMLKHNDVVTFAESTNLKDAAAVSHLLKRAKARKQLTDMGFDEDAKLLHAADAYSFNAETIGAIREAARGIPHDAPLSSIDTPSGSGWFWFAEPLPIMSSPLASERTHALLWGWTRGERRYKLTLDADFMQRVEPAIIDELNVAADASSDGSIDFTLLKRIMRSADVKPDEYDSLTEAVDTPAIVFSAYVVDEKGRLPGPKGTPHPSTRWYWPIDQSFHDMIAFNSVRWEAAYGPGGPYHDQSGIIDKDVTLKCMSELSLFFVMSCLWFKQTVPILTREAGHVERHARKRYVKEHKLDTAPSVHVVALRRSQRSAAADGPHEHQDGTREYHCRWIVKGHSRLQRCGPGRKDQKLIWIEAHPAGPENMPLRTREKVFAVIR